MVHKFDPGKNVKPMSLYAKLVLADIETSSHESDLYFPVTEESTKILNSCSLEKKISTQFRHQVNQQWWWEVPFGYIPFWQAKGF